MENLPEDAEHIKRLISGRKLIYQDANQVLTHILTALYNSFGQDKDEIVINTQVEEDPPAKSDPKQGTSKQAIETDKLTQNNSQGQNEGQAKTSGPAKT